MLQDSAVHGVMYGQQACVLLGVPEEQRQSCRRHFLSSTVLSSHICHTYSEKRACVKWHQLDHYKGIFKLKKKKFDKYSLWDKNPKKNERWKNETQFSLLGGGEQ